MGEGKRPGRVRRPAGWVEPEPEPEPELLEMVFEIPEELQVPEEN